MPIEIERKFLLASEDWRKKADKGTIFKQGYLNSQKERTVRIRIAGTKGLITVKGVTVKNSRAEFEYEIPLADAGELLLLCEKPLIEKRRYIVMENGMTWEVDVFEGENEGLILAEVELESEQQEVVLPDWVGEEVSGDVRYYNANLVGEPFGSWGV
ncbi:MAG: adenylate cyclase [Gammaproteobacteria bacterium]|jgi:adenylate cyclase